MKPEIEYYDNGNKYRERYKVNGKFHRLDGPAYIVYNDNGNKHIERYFNNGKFHRLDGPAWINFYENGNIEYEEYWINDIVIPQKEIDEILEQCNNDKQLFIDILTIRYS